MNTGCLKIFKKAAQFDEYNTFIPPHRRGEDIQLFRGDDDDDDDDDGDNDGDDGDNYYDGDICIMMHVVFVCNKK